LILWRGDVSHSQARGLGTRAKTTSIPSDLSLAM